MEAKIETKNVKDRIIDASLELFAKYGYKGTTTRAIAQKAGVNELTLFRNFGTKEGILKYVFEHRFTMLEEVYGNIKKELEYDLISDLARIAGLYQEKLAENIKLVMVILSEFEGDSNIYGLYLQIPKRLKELLMGYFDEMQQKGKMKKCHSEQAAIMFISMNVGYFVENMRFENRITATIIDDYIKSSIEIFTSGLLP